MAQINGEIRIERGIEDVFDFVADQTNEPRYNTEMQSSERFSDGPIGSGSRFKAVMRSGRREFPILIEFTTFERPFRLGSHTSMDAAAVDGELTFESVGEGATLMRWAWDVSPKGALRLLSPLVTWMGGRQETRIWTELKQLLEAGS